MDLIDRQAAIKVMTSVLWHLPNEWYRNLNEYEFSKGLAELGLNSVPSVQPERKTGKWILKELKWACDQCGCRIRRAKPFSGNMWNYYYCPNCGAKMKEGEQE